jgi:hypothetical protein
MNENYKVIKKILGNIYPVGETYEDSRRLMNLKETLEVLDLLLEDIHKVSENKNRVEYSMREAGKLADDFLIKLSWDIENDHQKLSSPLTSPKGE